jgi:hypothetical protein
LKVIYDEERGQSYASWKIYRERFRGFVREINKMTAKKTRTKAETALLTETKNRVQKYNDAIRLRNLTQSATRQDHGTRARYATGCKCPLCKKANTAYESDRAAKRKLGLDNRLVSAGRARAHLNLLSDKGIGRRTVQATTKIAETTLQLIKDGSKKHIRKDTEAKILSVTAKDAAPGSLIDAGPTWVLINKLLKKGHTKRGIASLMGLASSLQIRKGNIKMETAKKIQEIYDHIAA